ALLLYQAGRNVPTKIARIDEERTLRVGVPGGGRVRDGACPARQESDRMQKKEETMIELPADQKAALAGGKAVRLRDNGLEYVLVRADVFDRLAYHDSPWTDEEMELLAEEAGELLDQYRP